MSEPCQDCNGAGTIGAPPDNVCANCGGHGVIPAPGPGGIVLVAPPLDEPMPDCARCSHPATAHNGEDAECATCDDTYEPIGGWDQFPIRWRPVVSSTPREASE